jgi:hypothetical protein
MTGRADQMADERLDEMLRIAAENMAAIATDGRLDDDFRAETEGLASDLHDWANELDRWFEDFATAKELIA